MRVLVVALLCAVALATAMQEAHLLDVSDQQVARERKQIALITGALSLLEQGVSQQLVAIREYTVAAPPPPPLDPVQRAKLGLPPLNLQNVKISNAKGQIGVVRKGLSVTGTASGSANIGAATVSGSVKAGTNKNIQANGAVSLGKNNVNVGLDKSKAGLAAKVSGNVAGANVNAAFNKDSKGNIAVSGNVGGASGSANISKNKNGISGTATGSVGGNTANVAFSKDKNNLNVNVAGTTASGGTFNGQLSKNKKGQLDVAGALNNGGLAVKGSASLGGKAPGTVSVSGSYTDANGKVISGSFNKGKEGIALTANGQATKNVGGTQVTATANNINIAAGGGKLPTLSGNANVQIGNKNVGVNLDTGKITYEKKEADGTIIRIVNVGVLGAKKITISPNGQQKVEEIGFQDPTGLQARGFAAYKDVAEKWNNGDKSGAIKDAAHHLKNGVKEVYHQIKGDAKSPSFAEIDAEFRMATAEELESMLELLQQAQADRARLRNL